MREGKSGIGRDPRSCGPAAARLQNALQVLQVRRRSLRKTISNWRARKGGLSDMVATAAAIVPATVAALGARLQTKAQQGRRTGDITRLLRIPTYAGDGAQRTGQTSTDELPGTSGDHRELKDPHWPTQPAGWDVLACRDDPGSGGMSKLLGCPTDPLEHLRPDGISKAPVGHPRSFVF